MSLDAHAAAEAPLKNCLHCGAYASKRFRRVHGDQDNRAHRCPECDCWARLNAGSAAGRDVEYKERPGGNGRDRGRSKQAFATDGGDSDGV